MARLGLATTRDFGEDQKVSRPLRETNTYSNDSQTQMQKGFANYFD